MDWNQSEQFVERMFRRSKSVHSRIYYRYGIKVFKQFCDEKGLDVNQQNVYSILDSFVGWLDAKGIKPKTIADYMSAVRKFFSYLDITIEPNTFKNKVTMPRVTKIADEPLRVETVNTLLTQGRPNPKIRALILTLLSSGMRIGEALSIRVEDLDLTSSPATVKIRAEYAKTRTAREAYLSDEARDALREIIADAPKDRLVFEYSGNLWQREKSAVRTFREVVDRAGLDEKIENHRIHKIHFHSFRKFFLTKAVDVLGDHAGHALCGHGFYMDTYYRKTEEERKADYLKLMPSLLVSQSRLTEDAKAQVKIQVKKELLQILSGIVLENKTLRLDRKTLEVLAQGIPDPLDEEEQPSKEEAQPKTDPKKIIVEDQLEEHLAQGWDVQTVLPSGKILVHK